MEGKKYEEMFKTKQIEKQAANYKRHHADDQHAEKRICILNTFNCYNDLSGEDDELDEMTTTSASASTSRSDTPLSSMSSHPTNNNHYTTPINNHFLQYNDDQLMNYTRV